MKNERNKNRILVVSDDLTVRESFGDILRANGFEVLFAENGRKAAKTLTANAIDAVVLDYRTPFDAEDADYRRPATIEALTNIDPFLPLVLTCDSEIDLDHRTSLMADMVLNHPVEASILLDTIDTLLAETLKERVYRKSGHVAIFR